MSTIQPIWYCFVVWIAFPVVLSLWNIENGLIPYELNHYFFLLYLNIIT